MPSATVCRFADMIKAIRTQMIKATIAIRSDMRIFHTLLGLCFRGRTEKALHVILDRFLR